MLKEKDCLKRDMNSKPKMKAIYLQMKKFNKLSRFKTLMLDSLTFKQKNQNQKLSKF